MPKTVGYAVWPALSAIIAYAWGGGSLLCVVLTVVVCLSASYFRYFELPSPTPYLSDRTPQEIPGVQFTNGEWIYHFWFTMVSSMSLFSYLLFGVAKPLGWAFIASFVACFLLGIVRIIYLSWQAV
ncbi:MAG: hypothetical protein K2W82_11075 [Candidatus Obscuribacterales bacterium]|nr:hypothetical protein [Candidatus Obscuribacterales bacterium]